METILRLYRVSQNEAKPKSATTIKKSVPVAANTGV